MDVNRRRDQRDDFRGGSVIFRCLAVSMIVTAEEITRKASLRRAKEFSSPEALKEYLKEHPEADPKRHTVTKKEEPKKEDEVESESAGRFSVWKNRLPSFTPST